MLAYPAFAFVAAQATVRKQKKNLNIRGETHLSFKELVENFQQRSFVDGLDQVVIPAENSIPPK